MPFNGSGTYTLPAGNPVVSGTVISSATQNATMSDLAAALSNCITRDGQSGITNNISLDNHKLIDLADGVNATDAATVGQVQTVASAASTKLPLIGGTMTGNIVFNTGQPIGTPSSGIVGNCTVDSVDLVGFRNIPINSKSANYTLVLDDYGRCIFHPSTDANARTFTIPANSSVAYPIGTAISFVNMTSQVVSIAITTDTMYLAGAGATGTRSLAQYGTATALKMTATTWIISGAGLT